jgi:hypothetical protein
VFSLAARVPGLDIFGQGLIVRDSSGWQITPEGRAFLDWLESGCCVRECARGRAFAAPTRATAIAAGRCNATAANETWTVSRLKTAVCLRCAAPQSSKTTGWLGQLSRTQRSRRYGDPSHLSSGIECDLPDLPALCQTATAPVGG